jgi:hypothetical protein
MTKKRSATTTRRTKPSRVPGKAATPPKDWVPIQVPPNLESMYQSWIDCEEPNVGSCLLCDSPIRSADDMIPGTSSHNCAPGLALDEEIRAAEAAGSKRKPPARPAKRQSRPGSTGRSSVQEVQVGIFFWFNRKLFIQATPLSKSEQYAHSLTHPNGHPAFWSELQASVTVPAETEYDEVPRGRVTYDTVQDRAFLFHDRCIPTKAIRQIIRMLHLPKSKVVVSLDPHYRCPRCMEKGTENEES